MKRRLCVALLGLLGATAWADPSAAEMKRIDALIVALSKRSDVKFIRNGDEHDCAKAAEFLRGKLKWRLGKVKTVNDFIEQIASRSTTTGEIYTVRLADGKVITSADFLRGELARIEKP
jgi:hypothetical protein